MQMFWAVAFGILTLTLPSANLPYLVLFEFESGSIDLATIGTQFQDAISNQTNIPALDMGALIFYSGNIILDLMMNFFFAVPEMITLLIHILLEVIMPLNAQLVQWIQIFAGTFVTVIYIIGLLTFISNMRSGSGVV